MRKFALEEGMKYVYGGDNNTYCPKCEKLLIERSGFSVKKYILNPKCPDCGHKIPVVF
jgi:pyruvate formate lyase activating enzyme